MHKLRIILLGGRMDQENVNIFLEKIEEVPIFTN